MNNNKKKMVKKEKNSNRFGRTHTNVCRKCDELVRFRLRPQLIQNCGRRGSSNSSIFSIDERSNVLCSQYKSIKIMFNNIYGLRRNTSVCCCCCCYRICRLIKIFMCHFVLLKCNLHIKMKHTFITLHSKSDGGA